ncbi:hypothetical protein JOC77_003151 [Peribacillus deserti]|uniref:Uncharacterized protein n=1 Tax=Peribacillus deserti TaxID=673318 RepID=A0ABS2QKK5_9BACI|nr:hypothetical protein [Peribacillus deserti]
MELLKSTCYSSIFSYDFSLMPVIIMFLISWFHKRNPWVIGLTFAIITAFVSEPIFKWLGIYMPINWKYGYSIPFYTIIYYVAQKIAHSKHFIEL